MLNNGRFEDMTNARRNDIARRCITIGNLMAGSHSIQVIHEKNGMGDNCKDQDVNHP